LLDEDSKALAGGQSLVPLLNFRLAGPSRLVDINGLGELAYLRRSGGWLHIGALTRQATLERSRLVAEHWPLLTQAVRQVGHAQIRNRGTVGGSVAHADPTAELPAALSALDARFHLTSPRGRRTLAADDLFLGPLTTAIDVDELLVEIELPPLPTGAGTAFVEHARTHGDFAMCGAAAVIVPGERAAIALLGVGPRPLRARAAERAVAKGAAPREAATLAAEAVDDGYRRALVAELVHRAVENASP
jgi:CO/xanthine dehydrogenase FAD-binding subunit